MTRIVTCILVALALALNAEAKKEKPDKPDKSAERVGKKKDDPVIIVDPIGKDNDKGAVYSVPDTGSTLLLLGTAVLVLGIGIAGRRFAIR